MFSRLSAIIATMVIIVMTTLPTFATETIISENTNPFTLAVGNFSAKVPGTVTQFANDPNSGITLSRVQSGKWYLQDHDISSIIPDGSSCSFVGQIYDYNTGTSKNYFACIESGSLVLHHIGNDYCQNQTWNSSLGKYDCSSILMGTTTVGSGFQQDDINFMKVRQSTSYNASQFTALFYRKSGDIGVVDLQSCANGSCDTRALVEGRNVSAFSIGQDTNYLFVAYKDGITNDLVAKTFYVGSYSNPDAPNISAMTSVNEVTVTQNNRNASRLDFGVFRPANYGSIKPLLVFSDTDDDLSVYDEDLLGGGVGKVKNSTTAGTFKFSGINLSGLTNRVGFDTITSNEYDPNAHSYSWGGGLLIEDGAIIKLPSINKAYKGYYDGNGNYQSYIEYENNQYDPTTVKSYAIDGKGGFGYADITINSVSVPTYYVRTNSGIKGIRKSDFTDIEQFSLVDGLKNIWNKIPIKPMASASPTYMVNSSGENYIFRLFGNAPISQNGYQNAPSIVGTRSSSIPVGQGSIKMDIQMLDYSKISKVFAKVSQVGNTTISQLQTNCPGVSSYIGSSNGHRYGGISYYSPTAPISTNNSCYGIFSANNVGRYVKVIRPNGTFEETTFNQPYGNVCNYSPDNGGYYSCSMSLNITNQGEICSQATNWQDCNTNLELGPQSYPITSAKFNTGFFPLSDIISGYDASKSSTIEYGLIGENYPYNDAVILQATITSSTDGIPEAPVGGGVSISESFSTLLTFSDTIAYQINGTTNEITYSSYRIEVCPGATFTDTCVGKLQAVGNKTGNTKTIAVEGMSPNTQYTAKLFAIDNGTVVGNKATNLTTTTPSEFNGALNAYSGIHGGNEPDEYGYLSLNGSATGFGYFQMITCPEATLGNWATCIIGPTSTIGGDLSWLLYSKSLLPEGWNYVSILFKNTSGTVVSATPAGYYKIKPNTLSNSCSISGTGSTLVYDWDVNDTLLTATGASQECIASTNLTINSIPLTGQELSNGIHIPTTHYMSYVPLTLCSVDADALKYVGTNVWSVPERCNQVIEKPISFRHKEVWKIESSSGGLNMVLDQDPTLITGDYSPNFGEVPYRNMTFSVCGKNDTNCESGKPSVGFYTPLYATSIASAVPHDLKAGTEYLVKASGLAFVTNNFSQGYNAVSPIEWTYFSNANDVSCNPSDSFGLFRENGMIKMKKIKNDTACDSAGTFLVISNPLDKTQDVSMPYISTLGTDAQVPGGWDWMNTATGANVFVISTKASSNLCNGNVKCIESGFKETPAIKMNITLIPPPVVVDANNVTVGDLHYVDGVASFSGATIDATLQACGGTLPNGTGANVMPSCALAKSGIGGDKKLIGVYNDSLIFIGQNSNAVFLVNKFDGSGKSYLSDTLTNGGTYDDGSDFEVVAGQKIYQSKGVNPTGNGTAVTIGIFDFEHKSEGDITINFPVSMSSTRPIISKVDQSLFFLSKSPTNTAEIRVCEYDLSNLSTRCGTMNIPSDASCALKAKVVKMADKIGVIDHSSCGRQPNDNAYGIWTSPSNLSSWTLIKTAETGSDTLRYSFAKIDDNLPVAYLVLNDSQGSGYRIEKYSATVESTVGSITQHSSGIQFHYDQMDRYLYMYGGYDAGSPSTEATIFVAATSLETTPKEYALVYDDTLGWIWRIAIPGGASVGRVIYLKDVVKDTIVKDSPSVVLELIGTNRYTNAIVRRKLFNVNSISILQAGTSNFMNNLQELLTQAENTGNRTVLRVGKFIFSTEVQ